MPEVSRAQAAFVAMSKTPAGRAKLRAHGKKPMPVAVATEYQKASKGLSVSSLPAHHSGVEKATRRKSL